MQLNEDDCSLEFHCKVL